MTTDGEPRVCVVGAGRHSTSHLYPHLARAGARLVGVCDLDLEKAEKNARLFGGSAYENYETLLDAENPDAVLVCVGPAAHAELAPAIMRLGYPVYTEKPPATDAEDALEVVRAVEETGQLCMTAFKKRYAPPYDRAREWLDGFDPEERVAISVDYASSSYGDRNFLLDFAVHAIDLVGFLFGEVDRVRAFGRTEGAYGYAVSLEFECGAVGTMTLTDARSFGVPTEEVELTVEGGNWMTIHNSSAYRIVEDEQPVEWREHPTFISAGDDDGSTGHLREIEAFLEAVETGERPRSSVDESYRSMVLYEAIRDAVETGDTVDVEYELPTRGTTE